MLNKVDWEIDLVSTQNNTYENEITMPRSGNIKKFLTYQQRVFINEFYCSWGKIPVLFIIKSLFDSSWIDKRISLQKENIFALGCYCGYFDCADKEIFNVLSSLSNPKIRAVKAKEWINKLLNYNFDKKRIKESYKQLNSELFIPAESKLLQQIRTREGVDLTIQQTAAMLSIVLPLSLYFDGKDYFIVDDSFADGGYMYNDWLSEQTLKLDRYIKSAKQTNYPLKTFLKECSTPLFSTKPYLFKSLLQKVYGIEIRNDEISIPVNLDQAIKLSIYHSTPEAPNPRDILAYIKAMASLSMGIHGDFYFGWSLDSIIKDTLCWNYPHLSFSQTHDWMPLYIKIHHKLPLFSILYSELTDKCNTENELALAYGFRDGTEWGLDLLAKRYGHTVNEAQLLLNLKKDDLQRRYRKEDFKECYQSLFSLQVIFEDSPEYLDIVEKEHLRASFRHFAQMMTLIGGYKTVPDDPTVIVRNNKDKTGDEKEEATEVFDNPLEDYFASEKLFKLLMSEYSFSPTELSFLEKYHIYCTDELNFCNFDYIEYSKELELVQIMMLKAIAQDNHIYPKPYSVDDIDFRMDVSSFLSLPIILFELSNDFIKDSVSRGKFIVYDVLEDYKKQEPAKDEPPLVVLYNKIKALLKPDSSVLGLSCRKCFPVSTSERLESQGFKTISDIISVSKDLLITQCNLNVNDVKDITMFLFCHGYVFENSSYIEQHKKCTVKPNSCKNSEEKINTTDDAVCGNAFDAIPPKCKSTSLSDIKVPQSIVYVLRSHQINTVDDLRLCSWDCIDKGFHFIEKDKSALLKIAKEQNIEFLPYSIDTIDPRINPKDFLTTPFIQFKLQPRTFKRFISLGIKTAYDFIFTSYKSSELKTFTELFKRCQEQIPEDVSCLNTMCSNRFSYRLSKQLKYNTINTFSDLKKLSEKTIIENCRLNEDEIRSLRLFIFQHGIVLNNDNNPNPEDTLNLNSLCSEYFPKDISYKLSCRCIKTLGDLKIRDLQHVVKVCGLDTWQAQALETFILLHGFKMSSQQQKPLNIYLKNTEQASILTNSNVTESTSSGEEIEQAKDSSEYQQIKASVGQSSDRASIEQEPSFMDCCLLESMDLYKHLNM